MGLSAAIDAARTGLTVYQVATEITSENIANVNTPGYSRQRVLLENAPPTTHNGFALGTGVRISAVERYYDGLLQQQLVNADTTQSYDTQKSTVLQQIEPTFNEVANDGLGAAITNFFGAWQDLTLNPGGLSERQVILTRAQILTDNFHAVSKTLNDTISSQNDALVPLTDSINNTLSNIAQLNMQIKTTELLNSNSNETRDQRDQLIRDLSQKMGIKFTENTDGTTDVYVSRAGTNYYLIKGPDAGFLTATTTPSGNYAMAVHDVSGATATVDSSMYSGQDGGQLWATLQLRDSIIPDYLNQVDTLAKSVIDSVNAQHRVGFSTSGNTGQDFFTSTAVTAGAATGFSIDTGLTVATIAASGSPTLSGDNRNAVAIAQLAKAVTVPYGSATATYSSYYSSLVSKVGLDVQAIKTIVTQDEAFSKQLMSLRDSNSGVSLDEELTNLMKYQRSYQASAKLITTASEMLDMVIGLIR